jgi:hypothetical protein
VLIPVQGNSNNHPYIKRVHGRMSVQDSHDRISVRNSAYFTGKKLSEVSSVSSSEGEPVTFRQWATKILRNYIVNATEKRLTVVEHRVNRIEAETKAAFKSLFNDENTTLL